MRTWFSSRTPATGAAVSTPVAGQAYRDGRVDERRAEAATRREQRAEALRARPRRRRGAPFLTLIVLLVVAFGAVMLYLAARNGSFASGGAVIDHSLSNATQPVRNAEDRTGQALQNAGARLQRQAGDAPASSSGGASQ